MANGDKTTESRTVEPVVVTVIATGDASKLPAKIEATTEGAHFPDFIVRSFPPVRALAVRFGYMYFFTLNGFLAPKFLPASDDTIINAIQSTDFLHLLRTGCLIALVPAVGSLVKDIGVVFTRLQQKYPLLTGSV